MKRSLKMTAAKISPGSHYTEFGLRLNKPPSNACRHVLIMYKVLEGEGEVVFRAFPVGIPIQPPPSPPQPHPAFFVAMCLISI